MIAGGGGRLARAARPVVIRVRATGPVGLGALVWFGVAAPARAEEPRIVAGEVLPGWAIAVAPADGVPRVLCEPSCEVALPVGPTRIGWRREDREIEWQQTIVLDRDLRVDLRFVDRAAQRHAGYGLLVAAGVLLAATAIVGIATEPRPPETGRFGSRHALVFAGIAGGVVVAFGAPSVALAFERDPPGLEIVPFD